MTGKLGFPTEIGNGSFLSTHQFTLFSLIFFCDLISLITCIYISILHSEVYGLVYLAQHFSFCHQHQC